MYKPITNYQRVTPRDLFNEAKLLKSLGRLSLLIEDRMTPVEMSMNAEENEGFKIGLCDDGFLSVTNIKVLIEGKRYIFRSTYNSKKNYPLVVTHKDCDYTVFDEDGSFDDEFFDFLKTINATLFNAKNPEP